MQLRKALSLALCIATLSVSGAGNADMQEWLLHKSDDGVHPNAHEQQLMWLMNNARQNPSAEGSWLATSAEDEVAVGRDYFGVDTNKLRVEFERIEATPPAAWDVRLYSAARRHALNLIARDGQDHDGQNEEVSATSFNWRRYRGNVFSYADNALNAHAAFNIDWGTNPDGMQSGRGHRQAIMSTDGNYTNVGVVAIGESNPNTEVGEMVIVSNFCEAYTSTANHHNEFIVGTVFEDRNTNGRYDIGEGVPNIMVLPSRGSYFAVTSAGGGYSIPVTDVAAGPIEVRFQDVAGVVSDYKQTAVIQRDLNGKGKSVLVDYVVNAVDFPLDVFPSATLVPGVVETNNYGFQWGNKTAPVNLKVDFAGTGTDIAFRVQGFDIESSRDVEVFLNGGSVGFLEPKDNVLGDPNWFMLSSADIKDWNEIEFRQRTPGARWGVTNLEIRRLPGTEIKQLEIAGIDNARYGLLANGPDGHWGSVKTRFFARDRDLMLRVNGIDIDHNREVAVYVNDRLVRYLRPGRPGAVAPTNVITIRRSDLAADGNNTVEFRLNDMQGWRQTWGVTTLYLRDITPEDELLLLNGPVSQSYGVGYGISSIAAMRVVFDSAKEDVRVRYDAYDADMNKEISIYLNGSRIGYVPSTGANRSLRKYFDISGSDLNWGRNTIEFVRHNPMARWGIGRVQLQNLTRETVVLKPEEINREIYGFRVGTPTRSTHPGILRAVFDGQPKLYELRFDGWLIGNSSEVVVYLNNVAVGSVRPSVDPASSVNRIMLRPAGLVSGRNTIEFRVNSDSTDTRWGVSGLIVEARQSTTNLGGTEVASPLDSSQLTREPREAIDEVAERDDAFAQPASNGASAD